MHVLDGKRILIMGLGSFGGGVGAARFCAGKGAAVTVTDMRPESELRQSMEQLADLNIRYRLGGHDESDFTSADLVIVNPAVDRRNNRFLRAAQEAGVELTTEIGLFIERVDRQRVIGVTGTAGKSTTVAMIGHLLAASLGPDRMHIGGNLGGSLLGRLGRIQPDDWIVLELSSFMLEALHDWSPHIAVVTNVSDNHLDRHGSFAEYAAAKQRVLAFQQPEDWAVLGPRLPEVIRPRTRHHTIIGLPVNGFPRLSIPGEHNRLNALMALKAVECAGVHYQSPAAADEVLRSFTGLPHRLQLVLEHGDVRFYNDSKSTTPESAMLALGAFEPGQVHAILGGYDKKADLRPLAMRAAQHCAAVYTIGQTGDDIADAAGGSVQRCGTLEAAIRDAIGAARPGEVILLSPGCASWDQFANYEERGRRFAELALRYSSHE